MTDAIKNIRQLRHLKIIKTDQDWESFFRLWPATSCVEMASSKLNDNPIKRLNGIEIGMLSI